MDVLTSPQHSAEGEEGQFPQGQNRSFDSIFKGQKVGEKKLDLCPISIEQGIPTVEFTVDEVNSFTREEGLHQAVIFQFSYGKPELQELRRIFSKIVDVKGKCNIGQLEFRHILVRFDLYEDFANVVSRTSGFVKSKGEEFFFRTFPWTMGFNPREETPKALIWMSLPDLPANLFAKKSLLSIASMVGKPIAIDKATQDRTRPSTARAKILVNLLDNLPKKSKIKIIDENSGKIIEYEQRFVFDNLPKYCTFCYHQGHDVKSCRRILEDLSGQAGEPSLINVDKLKGDARVLLDAKIARRRTEGPVSLQDVVPASNCPELHNPNDGNIATDQAKCSIQQDTMHSSELFSAKENQNLSVLPIVEGQLIKQNATSLQQNSKLVPALTPLVAQLLPRTIDIAQHGKPPVRSNLKEKQVWKAVAQHKDGVPNVRSFIPNALSKNAYDSVRNTKNTVSLKAIILTDFDSSISNSTHELGSISGVKVMNAQQNSNACGDMDLDSSVVCHVKQLRLQIHPDVIDNVVIPNMSAHSGKSKDVVLQKGSRPHSSDANESTAMQATIASNGITGEKTVVSSDIAIKSAKKLPADEYCQQTEKVDADKNKTSVTNNDQYPAQIGEHIIGIEGHQSSRNSRSASPQNKNNLFSKKSTEITTSSNSFVALANIDKHDDKMMGGTIQKVQSYTPLSISSAYSGEDLNDNEEFSSLEGKNKQLIVANMRDMVIKSKLWDQQHYDDDESLDEGSGRWSSAEEDIDGTTKSAVIKKNADLTGITKQSYSGCKLNHNAQVFIPKNASTTELLKSNQLTLAVETKIHAGKRQGQYESSVIQTSSEKRHLLNAIESFEEGEEEEMLMQCRKDAARKGDLSAMHSKTNKKSRQRDRSWDGRVTEVASIRRPPMRIAKQKQLAQRTKA